MKKFFIVFLTSFLLGALTALYGANIYINTLGKSSNTSSIFQKKSLDLDKLLDVYTILEEKYFSDTQVQKTDLLNGAISGMVNSLGDKHSEFMNPEVYKKFDEGLNGEFEGIGAVVDKVPLGIKVDRILKGSPAKKYGIRSGDIIIEANSVMLEDLDIYDAIDEIKGPAGTQVILQIIREGESTLLEILVVREKIHIPSVEHEFFKEENIGYISINMYGETTAQEFKEALKDMQKVGVKGIIIDVRDNGGGYLKSAVDVLSGFIGKDELLVQTKYKDSFFSENYYSNNTGDIYTGKIVVLINGNSASASEITAGALREYDKAILIGERSYGKGSVQQPFDIEGGSLLKLTVAKWYTPKGVNIDGEGIDPDIEVEFIEEDYETRYDRQLEMAKKVLQIFIEKQTIGLSLEAYMNLGK